MTEGKWQSRMRKYIFEKSRYDGENVYSTWNYSPRKSENEQTEISSEKGVVKERYLLEVLRRDVEMEFPGVTLKSLVAHIKNRKRFRCLATLWIDEENPEQLNIEAFYFDNNKPDVYEFNDARKKSWPEDITPFVDARIYKFICELAEERPKAADSLWECMPYLAKSEEFGLPPAEIVTDEEENTM